MKKICILDLCNKGHHWFYNYSLMKEFSKSNKCYYFTSDLSLNQREMLKNENIDIIEFKVPSKNKFKRNINNFYVLKKVFNFAKREKVNKIFLLYLDDFIYQTSIYCSMNRNVEVVATLHWYREENLKEKFIANILRNCKVNFVVHSLEMKNRLLKLSCLNNISVVKYPMLENEDEITKEEARLYLNIDTKSPVLLYFGALRDDKGIDVFLESLKYLNNQVHVIIAGAEADFDKEFVIKNSNSLFRHKFTINISFVDDNVLKYYFKASDIVIVPYKKYFSGESGVFLEAINNGKAVVVPNICDFEQRINEYNNGVVFRSEDYEDLAEKTDFAINNLEQLSMNALKYINIIREEHSICNFIQGYKKYIKS